MTGSEWRSRLTWRTEEAAGRASRPRADRYRGSRARRPSAGRPSRVTSAARVARNFAALFPHSELHLLDCAGHYVQVDQPQRVADLIVGG